MVQMALFHPHYGNMGVIKQQSWGKRLQLCCASPAKELKVFLALDTALKMHFLEICKALFRVRGTDHCLEIILAPKKHQHRNASKIQVARKNMCSEEYARPTASWNRYPYCCAVDRQRQDFFTLRSQVHHELQRDFLDVHLHDFRREPSWQLPRSLGHQVLHIAVWQPYWENHLHIIIYVYIIYIMVFKCHVWLPEGTPYIFSTYFLTMLVILRVLTCINILWDV